MAIPAGDEAALQNAVGGYRYDFFNIYFALKLKKNIDMDGELKKK